MIDQVFDRPSVWLSKCVMDLSVQLTECVIDRLCDWLSAWLTKFVIDQVCDRPSVWLSECVMDLSVQLTECDWLSVWLT